MRYAPLLLLLPFLLSGCGLVETHEARDPLGRSSLIGVTLPDLIDEMGKPDEVMQTGPETAIIEYKHVENDAALQVTLTLLGTLKIGGGGGCNAVFTVLREGTVSDVTFPGSYSTGIFAPPYESCSPLIREALQHPGSTDLPAHYDAWPYLFPAAKP